MEAENMRGTGMDKLYIVIPAYNEEENIVNVVNDWYAVVEKTGPESRLVVVDDGSKDNTYQLLNDMAKTRPQLLPLTKVNGGHGPAVLYGYRYALGAGADYIFQTDSDGQTNPAEFDAFWQARREYDVVIGNRSVRGDGKARDFVEKVVCFLLRMYFGIKVSDANAPFRLMKADVLKKYIHRLPEDFSIPNIMFTTYFVYYGENIAFKEITFKPRQAGTTSLNVRKIVRIGWKALGDFKRLKAEM